MFKTDEQVLFNSGTPLVKNGNLFFTNGRVLNSKKEPLIGANLVDLGNKFNGETTDFNGSFEISGKNFDKVRVSYMGYESKEILFSELPNEIILKESVNNLDTVSLGTFKNKKNPIFLLVISLLAFLILFKK